MECSNGYAAKLAAALNEIDEHCGSTLNDFRIMEHITDHGAKYAVDIDAFNAVEVYWPATGCNQYRFIIPVGSEEDRAVVMWNRVTSAWEVLSGGLMPAFVTRLLVGDQAAARV